MNLEKLQQLKKLQSVQEYPSVSILAPTHRTAPDNAQDPIRLKNLVTDATSRLLDEFPRREVEPLLKKLDSAIQEIDWNYTLDGVALFVNKSSATRLDLPFPVQERVTIDGTFATRDLVFAINRSPRYRVLVLSEQPTRLFDGVRDCLQENTTGAFPILHDRPGGSEKLPGGHGVNASAHRDEHQRHFFREVDNELSGVQSGDELPVIVVGITRNLAFFDEITANAHHIAGRVEGSHDSTSPHELGQLAWPAMQDYLAAQRRETLNSLGAAVGAQRHAAGISEVWQLAHEGRGQTLLVEEDFHYAGSVDKSGLQLSPASEDADQTLTDFVPDAVDALVTAVLEMGGRVIFVDNGDLEQHARIALILRY